MNVGKVFLTKLLNFTLFGEIKEKDNDWFQNSLQCKGYC